MYKPSKGSICYECVYSVVEWVHRKKTHDTSTESFLRQHYFHEVDVNLSFYGGDVCLNEESS